MDLLKSTLGKKYQKKHNQISQTNNYSMKSLKSKSSHSIWILDIQCQTDNFQFHSSHIHNRNELNQDSLIKYEQKQKNLSNEQKIYNYGKFTETVKILLEKKFQLQNVKYLEEETFQEMINQLNQYLIDIPTELAKLSKIQESIIEIASTYFGDIKNYFKDFQSLLSVRIRKLKRKQKKTDLNEFDKILQDKQLMKKKNEVVYIDEDKDQKKHIQRKQNRIKKNKIHQVQSKKSYGTMNSGSNQNQSGSGRVSGGSQSRSSQNNALAVLLNNKQHIKRTTNNDEQKKCQKSQKNNNSHQNSSNYDFSLVMSTTVAVRQRQGKMKSKPHEKKQTSNILNCKNGTKIDSNGDQKDDAFIFHRPKKQKKLHF